MGVAAALRAELAVLLLLLCSASYALETSRPVTMGDQSPDATPEQRSLRASRSEASSFDEPDPEDEQAAEIEAASAPILDDMRAHLERRQSRENADLIRDRHGLIGGEAQCIKPSASTWHCILVSLVIPCLDSSLCPFRPHSLPHSQCIEPAVSTWHFILLPLVIPCLESSLWPFRPHFFLTAAISLARTESPSASVSAFYASPLLHSLSRRLVCSHWWCAGLALLPQCAPIPMDRSCGVLVVPAEQSDLSSARV